MLITKFLSNKQHNSTYVDSITVMISRALGYVFLLGRMSVYATHCYRDSSLEADTNSGSKTTYNLATWVG